MSLAEDADALFAELAEAEDLACTAVLSLKEQAEHRVSELHDFRVLLMEQVNQLIYAANDCISDIESRFHPVHADIHSSIDVVKVEVTAMATTIESQYQEHLLEFLDEGASHLAADFSAQVEHEVKEITKAVEDKLDKHMSEALSHVKSVIDSACEEIVHEFDKGADEMTKEVAAFRPILKEVESAVQPVIDGLNHIMGIAHSVGM
ncbi:uncharacterized protein YqgV (UPF0045/DUF77 family) [Bradyrhizobium sp. GM7.3]